MLSLNSKMYTQTYPDCTITMLAETYPALTALFGRDIMDKPINSKHKHKH